MALPNPIYVSPSTTFVQVDPLESPYNLVFLNSVVYPGQVVTVLDATNSIGVLTTPIVVSTIANTFQDGTISTVINQPQGFITAQSLTNTWSFLNSFPFRNQYLSAGVQNLTTSTLYTALGNTVQEYVSSLVVSKLTVTGNFLQKQGFTINTNVSSLGTVEFTSSVTVLGNTYLSSDLSSIGPVFLSSSLSVYGNLFTKSSIKTFSTMFVSDSVVAIGSLFYSTLNLKGSLAGTSFDILENNTTSLNVAGNIYVGGILSSFSSLYMGGPLQANTATVSQNAYFFSSVTLFQDATVNILTSTTKSLSSIGPLGVGTLLTVGHNLTVYDKIFVNESGYIQDDLIIGSTLIASSIQANILESYGDYSNLNTVAQISSAFVQTNVGAGMVNTQSMIVGGSIVTNTNLATKTLYVENALEVKNSVTALSYISVGKEVSIEGGLTVNQFLDVSSNLIIIEKARVLQSTILNLQSGDTSTLGNMYGSNDFYCDNTLTIGSITLPSNITAYNFTTNTMDVGSYGFFSSSYIQKIVTSSITIGYISSTDYAFDISGSILLGNDIFLSSPLVSTSQYTVGSNNSQLIVIGGLGVGVEPTIGSFVSQPIGYFLTSNVYVFSTLSTTAMIATDTIKGTFIGDASEMTGFNYPPSISVNQIFVSETATLNPFYNSHLKASTLQTSTLTNIGSIYAQSSITIGSFNIRGNASAIEYNLGYNVLQTSPAASLLVLNDVDIYGDTTETIQRRVAINQDYIPSLPFSTTLGVYTSLAVNSLQTDLFLYVDTYNARKVIASTLYGYGADPLILDTSKVTYKYTGVGNTYVSSGKITLNGGQFFQGEQEILNPRENSVQPRQSTLQFQSTLFVNRQNSRVGINTAQPMFDLDVKRVLNTMNMYGGVSSIVKNQITVTPLLSTQFYAFINSNTTYSNVVYSENLINWSNSKNLYTSQPINYGAYFSPGLSRSSFSDVFFPENQLPEAFLGTETVSFGESNQFWATISLPTYSFGNYGYYQATLQYTVNNPPDTMRSIATDGYTYVAVATANSSSNIYGSKFWYSQTNNMSNWNDISDSNLFPPWGRSNGGYSIVYGGMKTPIWIAVGAGSNVSAYKSSNVTDWLPLTTNVDELRAIITYSIPTTVFLATGGYLSNGLIVDGLVITSSNAGSIWTNVSPYLFSGSGTSLATDGAKVVVGGEDTSGNTLWYSYINESNTYTWTKCQGSLFSSRTNSVIWNGLTWTAGGNSGLLESSDGITWIVRSTPFASEVYSIGYTSNAAITIGVGSSNLFFQESPYLACQSLISAATISMYPSSLLNLNNACILDSKQNILVPGLFTTVMLSTSYTSTFYTPTAYISSLLSTNQVQVGGYYLGIDSV